MHRRDFLGKAAIAGAIASSLAPRVRAQAGPNSEIRVAVIGCGNRGPAIAKDASKVPGVKVVLACDVDPSRSGKLAKSMGGIAQEKDYRKVLERKDIDAVLIATPNHTHTVIAVAACLAGKDVYVEKPVSHNVHEGRVLAKVAEQTGRIVQSGLQNVSDKAIDPARDYYKSGALGKLVSVHTFWYNVRKPIGRVKKPTPVPSDIDYDLFCGPRPMVPLARAQLHYDWHWTWGAGSGEFGNTCVHNIDHTRYLLGITSHATAVQSIGGRFVWDDDGETPNTMLAMLRYPELPVPFTCEIRDLPYSPDRAEMEARFRKRTCGTYIVGEDGVLFFNRGGGYAEDKDGKKVKEFPGDAGATHMENFIAAMRARDSKILRSTAEAGHVSSCGCHLANISYRTGTVGVTFDEVEKSASADLLAATEALQSFKDHVLVNKVDMAKTPMVLGSFLEFDGKSERFVEKTEEGRMANYLVQDVYRPPFTLPS